MKTYNLFLDDYRVPKDVYKYLRDPDYRDLEWKIVRNYDQFVDYITSNYEKGYWPELITFDHDLSDKHYGHLSGDIPYDEFEEKTGLHCCQWLVNFCLDNDLKLPRYKMHTMNPAGGINMKGLLQNFEMFQSKDRS